MDKFFHLTIFTLEGILYEGECGSLVAPGEAGYLGILANHAPLVTTLRPGKIVCKQMNGPQKVFESRTQGLLEVLKNKVILILDEAGLLGRG